MLMSDTVVVSDQPGPRLTTADPVGPDSQSDNLNPIREVGERKMMHLQLNWARNRHIVAGVPKKRLIGRNYAGDMHFRLTSRPGGSPFPWP